MSIKRCVHLPRVFGVSGHGFRRLCERVNNERYKISNIIYQIF